MSKQLIAGYYRTYINGVEYTINMNRNKFLPAFGKENPYDIMKNYVEGTWAEIKALKDSSKLEPGTFYLINDYVTTTTQVETKAADHYFDVLVFALAKDQLSEQAWAVHSKRDTDGYFSNCKLESWELKYCIDNDFKHRGFADTVNGKGVIYYMKDENGNKLPYDFKNLMFKRYAITNIEYTGITQEKQTEYNNTFRYGMNGGKCFAMKDMWDNWLPQNFNITNGAYNSNNYRINWTIDENIYEWYYTYTTFKDNEPSNGVEDQSIFGMNTYYGYGCGENEIKPWYWEESKDYDYDKYEGNEQFLNNMVFFGYYSIYDDSRELYHTFANKFGVNCRYNQFGNYVYGNSFGHYVYGNSFGNDTEGNTFGNYVYGNSFGNYVYDNSFGNYVYDNSFGNEVSYNQFGNYVYGNSFGNYVYGNSFGNEVSYNQFGNYVYGNSFGNYVYDNSFGNYVYGNSFGNNVYNNSFGHYVYYWIVENNIKRLSFTDNYSTGNSNYLQNIHVLSGYNYDSGTAVPSGLQYNAKYVQLIGFSDNNNTVTIRNAV